MDLEKAVRTPVSEISFGETIPPTAIPRKKKDKMVMLAQLMRSEVHLPLPEIMCKDFTIEKQQEILNSLMGMSNRQLTRRIREEKERLSNEVVQQWPRGLAHP